MRIGLLLPLNISLAPYLKIYTDILDRLGMHYDVIYPNKLGYNEPAAHVFDVQTEHDGSKLSKLIYYWRFSRFLLRTLRQEKYDKLIVFGPQIAIFIARYLEKNYAGRFILDYRDLSIEQRFKRIYNHLLNYSAANVISSPGFKEFLPKRDDYILSHNFDVRILRNAIEDVRTEPYQLTIEDDKINVMNIGGIRHYEQNRDIIHALANNPRFTVTFAGSGFGVPPLQAYVKKNQVQNTVFTGHYDKKDEPSIIAHATFINIYYSLAPRNRTALSNRFYNSIMYRKPMITTHGTEHGKYAEEYHIGLAVKDVSNLAADLEKFCQQFNWQDYEQQRSKLLNSFLEDYDLFENRVREFTAE